MILILTVTLTLWSLVLLGYRRVTLTLCQYHLWGIFPTAASIRGIMNQQADKDEPTPTQQSKGANTVLTATVEKEYLNNHLTHDEAKGKLAIHFSPFQLALALLHSWELNRDLSTELTAAQEHQQAPRLDELIVADLIDHAFLTNDIDWQTATNYLISDGMQGSDADHHITTIWEIKNHEAERAEHLAAPDNAPRYCTTCGIKTTANRLSNRGNCSKCSEQIQWSVNMDLINKQGPYYRNWRKGMLQAMHNLEDEMIRESREREPSTLGDMVDLDKALYEANPLAYVEGRASLADAKPDPHDPETTPTTHWECPRCKVGIPYGQAVCPWCHSPKP